MSVRDAQAVGVAANGDAPHGSGAEAGGLPVSSRVVDGWTFISTAAEVVPANWGSGGGVLWPEGEPLMLVGPDGVGKTSLAQQVVLGRVGLRAEVLGLPVAPARQKVLYLAADRPSQAARSMRRMVTPDDADVIADRLRVHRGPLPFDVLREPPWTLRRFVQAQGASDVVIDSLKDLATDLSKDETGGAISRAVQECVADGVEVLLLHHQRKGQHGGAEPRRLPDVYGSRWLTAGMGSVLMLWGEPGDLVVAIKHLKQPAEEVGPFNVLHDHVRGHTTIHEHADLETLLHAAPNGLTAKDAAALLFTASDPQRNEVEKARRRLEALVGKGHAERRDDPDGLARYFTREEPA